MLNICHAEFILIELLVQNVVLERGGGGDPSKTRELQDPTSGDYSQDGTSVTEICSETWKSEFMCMFYI